LKTFIAALLLVLLPILAFGQVSDNGKPVKVITDLNIVGNVTMYNDTVYNLSGFVYVEAGEVLTIEPGTILKGNPGQGADATALIIARGGQIFADGTPSEPIILTSISDDLDNPNDIPLDNSGRGLWGGVIILGEAVINTTAGVGQIEGIPEDEPRGAYGGTNNDDNSGIFRYCSIRHGGSEIGAANEINGLTMGAVGRGTTISHVEVIFNLDDGFEWFGGTVNADHLIAGFVGDDAFDYDEGWRGAGDHWFSIHATDAGDRGGEHDGGTSPVEGDPYATPLITNATMLGRGADQVGTQRCFEIRDNAGTAYYNSIFADHGTYGIKIENSDAEPTDSRDRLLADHTKFMNNMWYGFGNGNTPADICNGDSFAQSAIFDSGNDLAENPVLVSISRVNNNQLDPRPLNLFNWGSWVDPDGPDGFFPTGAEIDVNWPPFDPPAHDYPGAFDPYLPMDQQWTANWTFLDFGGYFATTGCCRLRGDNNHDGVQDISDLTFMVDYLFGGGPAPYCLDEGDCNTSGGIDISDLTYYVDYMFGGGPVPDPC
jgi:hypothetical protein